MAAPARFFNQLRNCLIFLLGATINLIILIIARHRHIGWDFNHIQLVDFREFIRFRRRRAGHAGQLRVKPEVILEGDGSQRLILWLDRHMFLGFQGLMQAIGIAPAFHHAPGEFINNDDLVLPDNVFNIACEQGVRPQGLVHVMHERHIFSVIHIAFGQQPVLAE